MWRRSSTLSSLEVAWRVKAAWRSARVMPPPSSTTRMSFLPPPSTEISILVAPASMEFSISSLTTESGLSTTSPAAILSMTSLGSMWIISAPC